MQTSYESGTDTSFDVVGNTDGRTIYYQHETGTDSSTRRNYNCNYCKYIFWRFLILHKARAQGTGQATGVATFRGDGEFIMKIRRFIPDFISQTGNTRVTLQLRNFPNDTQSGSALGPFDISSSTQKSRYTCKSKSYCIKNRKHIN